MLVDEALGELRKMEFNCWPDSTVFIGAVRVFCEKGDLDMARGLLKKLDARELYPDMITYILICKGLCRDG